MTPAFCVAPTACFGLCLVQRERLLAEDVFAGFRRRDHLRGVLGVRRSEHHGVDLRISEDRLVAVGEVHALLLRERQVVVGLRARRRGTNLIVSLVPWTDSTSVFPHQPSPTCAALIIET